MGCFFCGGSSFSGCNLGLFFGLKTLNLLGSRLRLRLFGEIVEEFDKFAAGEDGLLEVVGEFEGVCRTIYDAELAESATSEIVVIFVEFFLLFAIPGIHRLDIKGNSTVRAYSLAGAAGDTFMVALIVVFEGKDCAEAVGHWEIVAIVGILLGDFGCDKLLTGYLHTFDKACQSGSEV